MSVDAELGAVLTGSIDRATRYRTSAGVWRAVHFCGDDHGRAYEDSTVMAGSGHLILGEPQVSQAGWRVWKREEGGGTREE